MSKHLISAMIEAGIIVFFLLMILLSPQFSNNETNLNRQGTPVERVE